MTSSGIPHMGTHRGPLSSLAYIVPLAAGGVLGLAHGDAAACALLMSVILPLAFMPLKAQSTLSQYACMVWAC